MEVKNAPSGNGIVDRLFKAGAHFAFSRSRRHPSATPFIFGTKQRVEIFDLEKTAEALEKAKNFVRALGAEGKAIVFVGGKPESQKIIRGAAERIGMPYVSGRWIGGTLTNAPEIKKRIARLEELRSQRESGELSKYTKLERLMIDRDITRLENSFGGIVSLKEGLPSALFVVDTRREHIALKEAAAVGIPVIGLANSDCDHHKVLFPIPANDTAVESIALIVDEIAEAYQAGRSGKTSA